MAMKILYIANFGNLKARMHKVSWHKLQALIRHPDFVCVDATMLSFSTLGRTPIIELIQAHHPDAIIHDAMWGVPGLMVSGLERVTAIPRFLMVEDYFPFADNIAAMQRRRQFDHYITIPLVATKHIPNSTWIGHYIPKYFNDYGETKDIDILFYGQRNDENRKVYPFRTRLLNIFTKTDLRVFTVPLIDHFSTEKDYVGENMARLINRAHLTISCTTSHNYMVKKYLEVPACKSTTIGDTNEETRLVFPQNEGIVEVSPLNTDDEIVDKALKFLERPLPNQKAYETARARHPDAYASKLAEIVRKVINVSGN